MIPFTRTRLGFEQRLSSSNPDLSHEEIPELSFPDCLGSIQHQADLLELRFLVLGDQNAGKSTFLHSLVDKDASHSTELLSFIPALSSSFVNARFFLNDYEDRDKLMDEPPFIDTDIARAASLLTVESFAFLAVEAEAEYNVPVGTRYVALEFAEFGGDHLDRIASMKEANDVEKEVIQSSIRIISECTVAAYFVNCQSLLNGREICKSRLEETRMRLKLLLGINPGMRLLIFASRTDQLPEGLDVLKDLSENLGCDILPCNHMVSGKLSAAGIFATVCACIKHTFQH